MIMVVFIFLIFFVILHSFPLLVCFMFCVVLCVSGIHKFEIFYRTLLIYLFMTSHPLHLRLHRNNTSFSQFDHFCAQNKGSPLEKSRGHSGIITWKLVNLRSEQQSFSLNRIQYESLYETTNTFDASL